MSSIKFKKRKGKFSLELNSHSLSYFQQCEKRYNFADIQLLTSVEEYYPFKRGEGISKYLALWYLAKQKSYNVKRLEEFEMKLFKRMCKAKYFENVKYCEDDKLHIASRLMGYFNKYRTENYPVVAVEQGFSKIVHEDANVIFIYSGRPDLVLDYGKFGIGFMDHKSESRRNDLTAFNNQFVGYCWGLGINIGMINYIGLQKDCKHNEVLRREAISFTDTQIEKWKADTTRWYFKVMRSIVNDDFTRSWNCTGRYGTCLYHPICISGSENEELIKIKRDYRKLEEAYRSW